MINFREVFENKLDKKEYIYSKGGTYIIRTKHSGDRFDDAQRKTSDKDQKELFKAAIKNVQKEGKKNRVYGFFLRRLKIGMVCAYREDNKGFVEGNHLIIITWIGYLPNKSISKTIDSFKMKNKSDKRVLLEQLGIENIDEIIMVEL